MSSARFTLALFAFLRDLREHNDREWFAANKQRYRDVVQEPALEFVESFGGHLAKLSPHLVADARPVGGSLFRIHRDVRFAKDKSPYKTHVGIHFRHAAGRGAHAPGIYVHLEPGESFVGVGIWRPDGDSARAIRAAIDERPDAWRRAAHAGLGKAGFQLRGDSLNRPPAGYAADHPLVEDLRRKDFIAAAPFAQRAVTGAGFTDEVARRCSAAGPYLAFLCRALGVSF